MRLSETFTRWDYYEPDGLSEYVTGPDWPTWLIPHPNAMDAYGECLEELQTAIAMHIGAPWEPAPWERTLTDEDYAVWAIRQILNLTTLENQTREQVAAYRLGMQESFPRSQRF